MKSSKKDFRHESLQDSQSILVVLKSITEGIESGKLTLGDEDGRIVLKPEGLLELDVYAVQENERNRLNIRISWQTKDKQVKNKKILTVSV